VAAGLPEDAYIKKSPLGDFALWNELKRQGHEVMPHGYRHENLRRNKGRAVLPRRPDLILVSV